MTLPEPVGVAPGHFAAHEALKAEYDSRHPDAPLPELGGGLIDGRQSHDVIHEFLAADHNAAYGDELQTELPPTPSQQEGIVAVIGSPAVGHIAAHNALHAAYNQRLEAHG